MKSKQKSFVCHPRQMSRRIFFLADKQERDKNMNIESKQQEYQQQVGIFYVFNQWHVIRNPLCKRFRETLSKEKMATYFVVIFLWKNKFEWCVWGWLMMLSKRKFIFVIFGLVFVVFCWSFLVCLPCQTKLVLIKRIIEEWKHFVRDGLFHLLWLMKL